MQESGRWQDGVFGVGGQTLGQEAPLESAGFKPLFLGGIKAASICSEFRPPPEVVWTWGFYSLVPGEERSFPFPCYSIAEGP